MRVDAVGNETFDRAVEVSAEAVEKHGFEDRAFEENVSLSDCRIQRIGIRGWFPLGGLLLVRYARCMHVRLWRNGYQRLWQRRSLGEKLSKRIHIGLLSRN